MRILFAMLFTAGAACAEPMTIEVRAGRHARGDTPVRAALPPSFSGAGDWRLARDDGGAREALFQIERDAAGKAVALHWILEEPLPAGETRRYRLARREGGATPAAAPAALCRDEAGRDLVLSLGGTEVARYHHAVVQPPAGVDAVFARSGYLHPVRTPAGRVVTNDFPANHLHHHGIWWAWTKTEFEGRDVDFWNSKERKGAVACLGVDATEEGPVFCGFRARHRFVDLTAPGGPKAALNETWDVRVYAAGGPRILDVTSTQTCAGPSPLKLLEYRYGGVGFRGAGSWEGKDGVEFLTSEGKARVEGHGTAARWCLMKGKVDGAPVWVAVLGHPANFRAPQRMRIHPDEPFFNYAPEQAGPFEIAPGTPYVSRYRFVVGDGEVTAAEIDRRWADYGEPPEAEAR